MVPKDALMSLLFVSISTGWAWGLLKMSYWWDCSAQRIQIWQAVSWKRLCYLGAWMALSCSLSVWCFCSAQFLFLLPFVIHYNVLRSTKDVFLLPAEAMASAMVWCRLISTMQVFPTLLRTLLVNLPSSLTEQMPQVVRRKYALLLVSRINPTVSVDKHGITWTVLR